MGVPDRVFSLQIARAKPIVGEGEPRAAVIVLAVLDPNGCAGFDDRAVLGHTIRNAGNDLREVQRRVGVMADAEKQDVPIQFVHTTNRTGRDMRRKRKWIRRDLRGGRAGGRKRKGVIAPHNTRLAPERVGDDTEVRCGWRLPEIERRVAISGPRRHHQRAIRSDRFAKRLDQAMRTSLDRPRRPERRMDEQYTAPLHAKGRELRRHLSSGQLTSIALAFTHVVFRLFDAHARPFASVSAGMDGGGLRESSVRYPDHSPFKAFTPRRIWGQRFGQRPPQLFSHPAGVLD
jgi:hypothetical protein